MPVLKANFGQIVDGFQDWPEGDYRVVIKDIIAGETKENKLPKLDFKLECIEGDYAGKTTTDFVTLATKEGGINELGYGRVKSYAAAILGEEAANGEEIDTDALKGGSCIIVLKKDTKPNPNDPTAAPRTRVVKVLPIN